VFEAFGRRDQMNLPSLLNKIAKAKLSPDSISIFDVPIETLNDIGSSVRSGDETSIQVVQYLVRHLTNKSGCVRIKMLKIIDHLVNEFPAFRKSLFSSSLREIVRCSGFLNGNPPNNYSFETRNLVLRLIEIWDTRFGKALPPLRAMSRYLRESLQISMPNVLV
jgi:hypothetical protein